MRKLLIYGLIVGMMVVGSGCGNLSAQPNTVYAVSLTDVSQLDIDDDYKFSSMVKEYADNECIIIVKYKK